MDGDVVRLTRLEPMIVGTLYVPRGVSLHVRVFVREETLEPAFEGVFDPLG